MRSADRFLGWVGRIELGLCVAMIIAIVLAVALQVVTRTFFNLPLGWVEEFAGFCFVWSTFLVRARVAPGLYYDSPPDSGFSVDNLAPAVPTSLTLDGTTLAWDEAPEPDFDFHTIYGSDTPDFAGAVLVDHTVAPTLDVSADFHPYYHVTTTDFAGNESAPSEQEFR